MGFVTRPSESNRGFELGGGRLGGVRVVRTDQPMLCKQRRATVFLRDSNPAASLAGDLPLGCLHGSPGARCLARRAIVLLELAQRPAQRGPLPASSANTTRRNAGIVECQFGLLSTFRAAPGHRPTLPTGKRSPAPGTRSFIPPRPCEEHAESTDWPLNQCSSAQSVAVQKTFICRRLLLPPLPAGSQA
jgi:hypothetical protein